MTLATRTRMLSGWGNTPVLPCAILRPEKQRDIETIYKQYGRPTIARGAGLSYGDAALQEEGVISTERLNRFLGFDREKGILHAQAGVSLQEVLAVTIPAGWIVPVIPGTQHVTLGGCVASNVHGKNHYSQGSFARHVIEIRLRLPGGEVVHCSNACHTEIFLATIGGMGMTGCIEEVMLQLRPILSASLQVDTMRVHNLEEMVAAFHQASTQADYMVGWIDHFVTGKTLGQGVFERAYHVGVKEGAPLATYQPSPPRFSVPCFLPSWVLNRYSMAMYNRVRFGRTASFPLPHVEDFHSFFHPLDGIGAWNRLYGRQGLLQYQCVVPDTSSVVSHLHQLLSHIHQSGLFSFLAVVKYHGPQEGMLPFAMKGFSLALDFPNTKQVHALLDQLDEKVSGMGGRVYLAKDARLKPEMFERMYEDMLPEWRRILRWLDPQHQVRSVMSTRLPFKRFS